MVVKAAQDNFLYLSDGETFRHHTKPEIMKEKTVLFSYGIRTHTPQIRQPISCMLLMVSYSLGILGWFNLALILHRNSY